MEIIRSRYSMSVSRISTKRVKRPRANWYELLRIIGDLRLDEKFWIHKSKHPKMSNNRIAYYVLKTNYSTTALERYRWFGEVPL